mmetsp:Transcript_22390/g.27575  ORF Transcript_22390/g.27575 Transcript_22390/m.27575 type:complete len:174 (+) Transcript_22390:57-578(+)|eukprot:CAMPEP_0114659096 /NCGR_PEP_ID=MMETSP0191-20121206/17083_1 /TAXON_ID=126664 /ORGANISM="Sorites sp." /LENGTH=173 /DNA_ID=CAMNT_0001883131 /DNA_START=79 /DNA_END=600 /DNA_ORIENTATION=-
MGNANGNLGYIYRYPSSFSDADWNEYVVNRLERPKIKPGFFDMNENPHLSGIPPRRPVGFWRQWFGMRPQVRTRNRFMPTLGKYPYSWAYFITPWSDLARPKYNEGVPVVGGEAMRKFRPDLATYKLGSKLDHFYPGATYAICIMTVYIAYDQFICGAKTGWKDLIRHYDSME